MTTIRYDSLHLQAQYIHLQSQQGIDGCGVHIAQAVAKAGFGDSLLSAANSNVPGYLEEFLPQWRKNLREELASNASGFAPRKSPAIAKRITQDFPRLDILRCYTHPVTSESEYNTPRGLDSLWRKRSDVAKIARVCELYFEWGVEAKIIKRFRSFLWPGVVLRTLLYTALDNEKENGSRILSNEQALETPSKALARQLNKVGLTSNFDINHTILTIHSQRQHKSTDELLEYRLEINPKEFVSRARSGIQGTRVETHDSAAVESSEDDESSDKEDMEINPDSPLRVWMPAVIVTHVCPALVDKYVSAKVSKGQKKKSAKSKGSVSNKTVKTKSHDKQICLTEFVKPHDKDQLSDSSIVDPVHPECSRSRSILERLDNDPIIKEISTPSKAKPPRAQSGPAPSQTTNFDDLRPFPVTLEDEDDIFNPTAKSETPVAYSRKQSLSSDMYSSDQLPTKKSPRKNKLQNSPHSKAVKTQISLKPTARPLTLLKQRSEKSKCDSDVIVISSDSESEIILEKLSFKKSAPRAADCIDLT